MSLKNTFNVRVMRLLIGRVIQINRNVRLATLYHLVTHFDLPLSGEADSNDEALIEAVNIFCNWKPGLTGDHETNANVDYLDWLKNDEASNSYRKLSFRLSHWLADSNEQRIEIENTFYSVFEEKLEPIRGLDLWKLQFKTRRNRNLRYRLLKDSKSHKIDIRLSDLTTVIPLISVLLLCAGYLHTSIVYKHFNIDPTRYFSVGDYLAASLEQIRHALYSLLGYVAGVVHGYRNQSIATKFERKTNANKERYRQILRYIFFGGILVVSYVRWNVIGIVPQVHIFLVVALLVVFQEPVYFISDRYFKNSMSVGIVAIVLLIFFSSMFVGAKSRIAQIESRNESQTFEIVAKTNKYSHTESVIIGANSNFMFLIERNNNVVVIPLKTIDLIKF